MANILEKATNAYKVTYLGRKGYWINGDVYEEGCVYVVDKETFPIYLLYLDEYIKDNMIYEEICYLTDKKRFAERIK